VTTQRIYSIPQALDLIDLLEGDNEILSRKVRDLESALRQAIAQRDIARQQRDDARMVVDSWKLGP
jgi:hypothetical protein